MNYGKRSNAIKRTGTTGTGTKPPKKSSWVDDCGIGINLALIILLTIGYVGKLPNSYANADTDSGRIVAAEQPTGSGSSNSGNGETRSSQAVSETSRGLGEASKGTTGQSAKGDGTSGQVRPGSSKGKGYAPVHKTVQDPTPKPNPGASDGIGDCIFSDYEDWKNEWVAYASKISDCNKGFLTKLRGESGWNFNQPSKVVIKAVYRMMSKDKAGKEVITEFVKTGSNLRSKLANGAKMVKVLAREPSKGFCQIHRDHHPEMWKDARLWTDWKYQIETCYRLYHGGTAMYATRNGAQYLTRRKHNIILK